MTSTDTPARPLRRTHQRELVTSVFDDTDQWLTAQQIHNKLAERGEKVGLATVYRTLAVLVETGGLDAIHAHGTGANPPEWSYRRCSTQHHHHLTCRRCGRTVEIAAPPIENWAAYMASTHGYTAIEHVIEVSGLCPTCQ
ncbi:MAG: transcriptional repressor [Propionibacteriaceae bacterium]|nr:transcriptional repressor [Propionibacteriaceae bacterium]